MMLFRLLITTGLLLLTTTGFAAQKTASIYSDGIIIKEEAVVIKGVVELVLPSSIREHSLRVKPIGNGKIEQVELLPARITAKQQKTMDNLEEQKSRLQDRLKALADKETVFIAAAKSQSSKTPRATKANPNPMAAIRQGTDFAITQLEAVNTARRQTLKELKRLDEAIFAAQNNVTGQTVRVLATANKVVITALLQENGWVPAYDIRLQKDGNALVSLLAKTPLLAGDYNLLVIGSSLDDSQPVVQKPAKAGSIVTISQWNMAVEGLQISHNPLVSCNFTFKNLTPVPFATGEAAIYLEDEYLGKVTLPAVEPDGVVSVQYPPM
jgi:hypothetical protein